MKIFREIKNQREVTTFQHLEHVPAEPVEFSHYLPLYSSTKSVHGSLMTLGLPEALFFEQNAH